MNTHETPIQLSMPLTPWSQLVTPILVARTSARRARPIAAEFLKRYPTARDFQAPRAEAAPIFLLHVHRLIEPLGLAAVRVSAIANVATWFVPHLANMNPVAVPSRSDIIAIPGCGRYVADSFDLFYRGDLDCEPVDPILIAYRDETRRRFADVRARTYETFTASRCLECEDDR